MPPPIRIPRAALSLARPRTILPASLRCPICPPAQRRTLSLPALRGPFGVTTSHPPSPGSTGGPARARTYASKRPPFVSPHDDIPSFKAYASAVGLLPTTTIYVGTLYEYTVLLSLQRLAPGCFALSRTGGANDRGVDLCGSFTPPHHPSVPARTLPVFVQCKAEQKRTGPKYMRELEGTLASVQREGEEECLGILAAVGTCTKGMREQMVGSRRPLVYMCVAGPDEGGWVKQMVWNDAASEVMGRGVTVGIRYVEGREEVMLMLDGVPVSGLGKEGSAEETQ